MILTITLNPCIDKSSFVDVIKPESKLRCNDILHEPGGGGINVSKALQKLDTKSTALFPAGGHNGAMLQTLLQNANIEFNAVDTKVETRENWIVLEGSTNNQYRFTFPGQPVEPKAIENLIDTIRSFAPTYVIASGSLPPGLPDYFYGLIVKTANAAGAKCIIDTSGAALQAVKGKHAFLIKPNINELSKMLAIDHIAENEVDDAAQQAVRDGYAEILVVSMGPDGAWLVSNDRKYFAPAPPVEKKSTVGAGDSMVAGITYQLQKGSSLREALQFGIACGSAATMNDGSQLFKADDARELYEIIRSNK
jgi:6-phosphofructokinase 2